MFGGRDALPCLGKLHQSLVMKRFIANLLHPGWTNFGALASGAEEDEGSMLGRPGSAARSAGSPAGTLAAASAAALAAGSPVTSIGPANSGNGGPPKHSQLSGYTCVAAAARDGADALVAGTAGSRLRWVDLETGTLRADLYCRPLSRWQVIMQLTGRLRHAWHPPGACDGSISWVLALCVWILFTSSSSLIVRLKLWSVTSTSPGFSTLARWVRFSLTCQGLNPLLLQGQGSSAVVAVQQARGAGQSPEGWLGVGLASGHAAVVDARCGALSAFWQAHEAGLSALSCCGSDMLLTGSQVKQFRDLPQFVVLRLSC